MQPHQLYTIRIAVIQVFSLIQNPDVTNEGRLPEAYTTLQVNIINFDT